jgi:hypothetical protein
MTPVEIRFASSAAEQAAALALVRRMYTHKGYVEDLQPLGGDGQTIVASSGDEIIGTAAVSLGRPLPTETYYGIQVEPGAAEVGRLAVEGDDLTHELALLGILAGIQFWGDANGVQTMLASLKRALKIRLGSIGIGSTTVGRPELLDSAVVPREYWGYFFPPKAQHRPVAVTISLDEVRPAVLRNLELANGGVCMGSEFTPVARAS